MARVSRIDESRSVWGSRFGAIGGARTGTMQNRVLLSAPLGGTWRVLVGYPRRPRKDLAEGKCPSDSDSHENLKSSLVVRGGMLGTSEYA